MIVFSELSLEMAIYIGKKLLAKFCKINNRRIQQQRFFTLNLLFTIGKTYLLRLLEELMDNMHIKLNMHVGKHFVLLAYLKRFKNRNKSSIIVILLKPVQKTTYADLHNEINMLRKLRLQTSLKSSHNKEKYL